MSRLLGLFASIAFVLFSASCGQRGSASLAQSSSRATTGVATTVVAWGTGTPIPALTDVASAAVGSAHSLAVKQDGSVVAWGANPEGQTAVPDGLTGVVAVAAGSSHSLALKADGIVVAWGGNALGQAAVPPGLTGVTAIAAGTDFSLALRDDRTVVAWGAAPAVPDGLSGVVAIAAGDGHALALEQDGTVVSWGSGPAVPPGLTGVVAVAAGGVRSMALLADGTVVAWGGDAPPAGLAGVVAIASGNQHSLALKGDGTVVAWGQNGFGQVSVPPGLSDVESIAAGLYTSLAVKRDGTIVVWGVQGNGQSTVPPGLTDVLDVAAGSQHSLAVKSDGTVVAWGFDSNGQASVPAGLAGVTAVAGGSRHSLALRADGTVVAWGDDTYGQTAVPEWLSGVRAIAAGASHSLALRSDGIVVAWGSGWTVPSWLTDVIAIEAGVQHSLALKSDGTVVEWRQDGSLTTLPGELTDVIAIAAGSYYSLAVRIDGTVVAWGSFPAPAEVLAVPPGLTQVVSVTAGRNHAVALKSDGTVVAWGIAAVGSTDVPPGLDGVTAVAAGGWHTLALVGTATVDVPRYALTVARSGLGKGTVVSSPASVDCGGTCSAEVAEGTLVSLTATPEAGSLFDRWAGCETVSGNVCTVTMSSARSVWAWFKPVAFTLTATSSGLGKGTIEAEGATLACSGATCTASVANTAPATVVTLTATPDGSSLFDAWSGCTSVSGNVCTVAMSAARSVTATFRPTQLQLTVATSGLGKGGVTAQGATLAYDGVRYTAMVPNTTPASVVTLTAVPDGSSLFQSWTGCTTVSGNVCTVTMTAARYVTATFKPAGFALNVSSMGPGKGTLSAQGAALSCSGTTCTATVANTSPATVVTLTATPEAGSLFDRWAGCTTVSGNVCTVTMSSARNVWAYFKPAAFALKVTATGLGQGTIAAEGATLVCEGTTCTAVVANTSPATVVTLTATSDAGSMLRGWSGCTSVAGDVCTVTMSAAKTVTAQFDLLVSGSP